MRFLPVLNLAGDRHWVPTLDSLWYYCKQWAVFFLLALLCQHRCWKARRRVLQDRQKHLSFSRKYRTKPLAEREQPGLRLVCRGGRRAAALGLLVGLICFGSWPTGGYAAPAETLPHTSLGGLLLPRVSVIGDQMSGSPRAQCQLGASAPLADAAQTYGERSGPSRQRNLWAPMPGRHGLPPFCRGRTSPAAACAHISVPLDTAASVPQQVRRLCASLAPWSADPPAEPVGETPSFVLLTAVSPSSLTSKDELGPLPSSPPSQHAPPPPGHPPCPSLSRRFEAPWPVPGVYGRRQPVANGSSDLRLASGLLGTSEGRHPDYFCPVGDAGNIMRRTDSCGFQQRRPAVGHHPRRFVALIARRPPPTRCAGHRLQRGGRLISGNSPRELSSSCSDVSETCGSRSNRSWIFGTAAQHGGCLAYLRRSVVVLRRLCCRSCCSLLSATCRTAPDRFDGCRASVYLDPALPRRAWAPSLCIVVRPPCGLVLGVSPPEAPTREMQGWLILPVDRCPHLPLGGTLAGTGISEPAATVLTGPLGLSGFAKAWVSCRYGSEWCSEESDRYSPDLRGNVFPLLGFHWHADVLTRRHIALTSVPLLHRLSEAPPPGLLLFSLVSCLLRFPPPPPPVGLWSKRFGARGPAHEPPASEPAARGFPCWEIATSPSLPP